MRRLFTSPLGRRRPSVGRAPVYQLPPAVAAPAAARLVPGNAPPPAATHPALAESAPESPETSAESAPESPESLPAQSPPTLLAQPREPSPEIPRFWVPLPTDLIIALTWPRSRGCYIARQVLHGAFPEPKLPPLMDSVTSKDFGHELTRLLLVDWPNIYGKTLNDHYTFWISQWEKHGRYSGMTLQTYFRTVLALFKKVPNFTAMGLEMDVPKMISVVRNSIKTSECFPFEPEVNIVHSRDGKLYLLELRFRAHEVPQIMDIGVSEFRDRGHPPYSLCDKSPGGPLNPPLTNAHSAILPRRRIPWDDNV